MTSGQLPSEEHDGPQVQVSYRGHWLAFASLACGFAQVIFLAFGPIVVLSAVAAIVLGVVALWQIGSTGQGGKWMAIAGIILGSLGILLMAGLIMMIGPGGPAG